MLARTTLFLVVGLSLYMGLQASGVSAKECVPDVTYLPDPPVAGKEIVITYSRLGLDQSLGDPDCTIGTGAEGELEARFSAHGPGGDLSVALERVNLWQYRANVAFPTAGTWQLVFDFAFPTSAAPVRRSTYPVTVDVLPRGALPSAGAGFGDRGAGVHTSVLAYALATAGGAALFIGGLTRIVGRRS